MIDLDFYQVSKRYRIRTHSRGFSRAARDRSKSRRDFWALRDVSFQVSRGETLGIIGANGAGKSTVLKLLSKITLPTSGQITIDGKLSALIEIGSGFHPELTGRENIYLSGSILGMRRREIAQKLDSIVDFAGFPRFIDTPVKHYSSGMCVRLGFSIAAHLHPDILLLDEVLAVGDAAFQVKCFKRIAQLKESGTTIVFISHDLNAVEFLCDRALLLSHGEIIADGPSRDVIIRYQQNGTGIPETPTAAATSREMPGTIRITNLSFVDYEGRRTACARTGCPLTARLEFEASEPIEDIIFEIFYYSQDGNVQCQFSTASRNDRIDVGPGTGTVEFSCAALGLLAGSYYVDATIKYREGREQIDWQYRCAVLQVDSDKAVIGRHYSAHDWRIIQHALAYQPLPDRESLVGYAE